MTKEEYLQLVQSSDTFKSMTANAQNMILKAEGEEMEKYANIFVSERAQLNQAKKEVIIQSAELVAGMNSTLSNAQKDGYKELEDKSVANDVLEEEKLTKLLNNN